MVRIFTTSWYTSASQFACVVLGRGLHEDRCTKMPRPHTVYALLTACVVFSDRPSRKVRRIGPEPCANSITLSVCVPGCRCTHKMAEMYAAFARVFFRACTKVCSMHRPRWLSSRKMETVCAETFCRLRIDDFDGRVCVLCR